MATGSRLHIIGKPAFDLSEKAVRRAGLDYWDELDLKLHSDWQEFLHTVQDPTRVFLFTKFGEKRYTDAFFKDGDYLIFGNETSGLPQEAHNSILEENRLKIPMLSISRSLNLSNSVALALYEGIRQTCIF